MGHNSTAMHPKVPKNELKKQTIVLLKNAQILILFFYGWYMGQNMWTNIRTWQPRVMCVLKTHNYLFQSSSALSKEGQKIGKKRFSENP